MKKISFFIGSMGKGGAERVISILANYYANNGYQVDIILLLSNKIEYQLNENINVINLSTNTNNFIALFYWLKVIRNYVLKEKPYKIISFIGRINLLVICACLGLNVNIYCSERNDPQNDGRSKLLVKLIELFYLNKNCKKIIFQTEYIKNCFSKYVKDKSVIIYNPVVVNVVRKQPLKKIVTVGRLAEQKNQVLLIESFKELVTKYPDYTLYIYGEGYLRKFLEQRIIALNLQDKVFLPGNIDNIHEAISDAKIFVLPSKYEGLSNALLEAMIIGIPCISTKVSGIEEIIRDGINGLLIKDKNELLDRIIELLEDSIKYNNISKKSFKIESKFCLENILKQWNKVMNI